MKITWVTPAGAFPTLIERLPAELALEAWSSVGAITYKVISGTLPSGIRIVSDVTVTESPVTNEVYSKYTTIGHIKGTPVEVRDLHTSRFVIRASDGVTVADRTFYIAVDGADIPVWATSDDFLEIGVGNTHYVLDNSYVNTKLVATDSDITAGDILTYKLIRNAGEFPPGLTLSTDGTISGFTSPIDALEFNGIANGGYDTTPWDIMPLDFIDANSTGYDTYQFDTATFDYSEYDRSKRRLSRIYTFSVEVSDGVHSVSRIFKIYVVTDDFLKSLNIGITRVPLWITDAYLGRIRANNYVTILLDVFDPPSLEGTIFYFLMDTNPDNTPSILPPGMTLDSTTGDIAGAVPYQDRITVNYKFTMLAVNFSTSLATLTYNLQGDWNSTTEYRVNDAARYNNFIYVCVIPNINVLPTNTDTWFTGLTSAPRTFTVDIIGEIESAIEWITPSNLGTASPDHPVMLELAAVNLISDSLAYTLDSGNLPPGLSLLPTGVIKGKPRQFFNSVTNEPGLIRFYDIIDGQRSFNTTFDGDTTTFDKIFKFTVNAHDLANLIVVPRTFELTVLENDNVYANLYAKALLSKEQRLYWNSFITDYAIFTPDFLFRNGDVNYGIQSELKTLIFAGIESKAALSFVQAMSINHGTKSLLFGEVKTAKAKDPVTQEVIYEVVYVDIIDPLESKGTSISKVVTLPTNTNSKKLTSIDSFTVDGTFWLASDSDKHQLFPNSIKNMRKQIGTIGSIDRTYLPQWMTSIQDGDVHELGYVNALVLCYTLPNKAAIIATNIKKSSTASRGEWQSTIYYQVGDSIIHLGFYYECLRNNLNSLPSLDSNDWARNFDIKTIHFTIDRYLIDAVDGIQTDRYLAFPTHREP